MSEHAAHIAHAAWLGAIIDRLDRGEPPLAFGDEVAKSRDRERFFSALSKREVRSALMHDHHSWREVACDPVRAELFERIHSRMKEHEFEEEFWSDVLITSPTPPPVSVVRDLIARDIEVVLIGHFLLPDSLLWELADRVDESLLTLGKRRYVNDEFSADQLEEVLYAFPTHHWLLESLAHEEPSDNEKVARLVSYISRMPHASKIIKGSSETFATLWREAR